MQAEEVRGLIEDETDSDSNASADDVEDADDPFASYGAEIEAEKDKSKVTAREYYASLLMTRSLQDNGLGYLHRFERLRDEFAVDAWVTVEDSRLEFYKKHQNEFRKERQKGNLKKKKIVYM